MMLYIDYIMNNPNITYKLSKWYSSHIEEGNLIDYQILSSVFFIPYLYCQDVYDNFSFIVELFYNKIKIFECEFEFEFELFDDNNNDENKLKKIKWKPKDIRDKYIRHFFENIETKDYYILDGNFIVIFNMDLEINGYEYELINGEGSYDWDLDKIIIQ